MTNVERDNLINSNTRKKYAIIELADKRYAVGVRLKRIKYDDETEIEKFISKNRNKNFISITTDVFTSNKKTYYSFDEFFNRNIEIDAKKQGVDEWLVRCKKCKHCRISKKDADDVYCTLKSCRFEPN